MKKILLIAGPNGAGKTTFAEEFLPREAGCPEFVNADLIAAGLSPFRPDRVAFTAGRLMQGRIRELAAAGTNFALETTLSTRGYLRLIPQWQEAGYLVKLCFLKLPDAEFAIQRVAQRVALGGHAIPEKTIRRRFTRGWENLKHDYLGTVNQWAIYDASQTPPRLLETGDNSTPRRLMEDTEPYQTESNEHEKPEPVSPLDDPDFIGAEAALKRASAKAIAKAHAAGLEPVIAESAASVEKP